ncbi:ABC transporter permease, partial [Bacillus spizizenii]
MKNRLFDILIYGFLLMFALICVLPFIHVIAASFATVEEVVSKTFILI